jgi:hypothetical protein
VIKLLALISILLFLASKSYAQALAAHAGSDFAQGDSLSITQLSGSASGGTPPYTYAWRTLTKPNGNDWCANILNPTNAATEVLMTGVFSNPFGTNYSYQLKVTDAVSATALDTVVVTVNYSSPAPPQATGSGFHYVTSADSIADTFHQMSPSRHDVWIDGANTDHYAQGGAKNSAVSIANAFAVYPNARVFVSAGIYFYIDLTISKDSIFATRANPWYFVPYGGQVQLFDAFIPRGTWKYCVITGEYNTTLKIGSVNYPGHKFGNYAFSAGTYGWYFNNGYKNIDDPGIQFGVADSVHDVEISYCEGINGGSYFMLLGNTAKTSPIYNFKIDNNYMHDSWSEIYYLMRTQADPQQRADSFQIYNNRCVRSGLEIDQFGQNGVSTVSHNNVFWLSATNWLSPFDVNQAFGAQRFYRDNGDKIEGNIYVGSAEQTLSLIGTIPSGATLATDSIYIRKTVVYNSKGFADVYVGAANAAAFNFVFDSCYLGNRPHVYLASKVYNNTSNNFAPDAWSIKTAQNFTSPPVTFNLRHMRYDTTGKKSRLDAGVSNTTYSDTARMVMPPLNFINTGFADNATFPNKFTRWIDTIYNTFKDEDANVTEVNQNSPYTFNVGDYVQHVGKIYLCLTQNQGHPPIGASDSFWQLQSWIKPNGTITYTPPDDLRLPASDFFAKQGIGLIDQYRGTYIIIPTGAKIKAF